MRDSSFPGHDPGGGSGRSRSVYDSYLRGVRRKRYDDIYYAYKFEVLFKIHFSLERTNISLKNI